MTAKPYGITAPDGSSYVTLTDGSGNLAPASGGGGSNPNGQATMANSAPVVIASDQSAVPVSLTSTTITGTVAATQSGTWTVQPGNTANTTAWKVDGSAVTQPISGTVTIIGPTPDGTAASTNPVLIAGTTDGTATGLVAVPKVTAGGVVSVDGSASTQPISAASLPLPTGAATSSAQTTMATNQTVLQAPVAPGAATATKAELIAGQYNSAVQTFTNGQQGSLQFDQRGGLLVQDGQAIASVSVTSAATLFTVADTSGYGSISVQVTSAGTTCTVAYEASEDGTTWSAVTGQSPANTGNNTPVTVTSAVGLLIFNISSKQFRVRVSSYTSGTVTVQGTLRKDPVSRVAFAIGNTVSSTGSIGDAGSVASNAMPTIYEGRTTNKTAVTTGQYVRPIATSIGAAINKPFQVPELDWTYAAAAGGITNTTTAVTIVSAAGAGIRNYLTGLQISNSTLGAGTEFAVRDGAGGTVLWRGILATAASDPGAISFPTPLRGTANTLMEVVTLTASVTGAVYFNAQGYQAP